jgi:hypothetical protein
MPFFADWRPDRFPASPAAGAPGSRVLESASSVGVGDPAKEIAQLLARRGQGLRGEDQVPSGLLRTHRFDVRDGNQQALDYQLQSANCEALLGRSEAGKAARQYSRSITRARLRSKSSSAMVSPMERRPCRRDR